MDLEVEVGLVSSKNGHWRGLGADRRLACDCWLEIRGPGVPSAMDGMFASHNFVSDPHHRCVGI